MSRHAPSSAIVLLLALMAPGVARAAWPTDPYGGNVPLCTAAGAQTNATSVSDGAGGAIVTWTDSRSGFDIYVQRVNAAGVPQWTANGVALCTAASEQSYSTVVSDGAGGAIVTWQDFRGGLTYDLYAQRVNASGVPQWAPNGVPVCTAAGDQNYPTIASDGASGAIITWYDPRAGNNDIYAQRVSASGVPQWTANGVALCTAAGNQFFPNVVPDGAGGAILTWFDFRNGANYDIYAHRVNSAGVPQWAANGVPVCTAAGAQQDPTIVSDAAGGAIVTWNDSRSGNFDIYAQRVSATGVPQWTFDGVAVCTATGNQTIPTIASDGASGAVITWPDARSGGSDVYAQRMSAGGVALWTANGVPLCTAAGNQNVPSIVSDGAGGAIAVWQDLRNTDSDVYSMRVNAAGVTQGPTNGTLVCAAAGTQLILTLVSDGTGGAIISWQDNRSATYDIYSQRVDRFGYLGNPEPVIASVRDVPNDQGGMVKVSWYASYLDGFSDPSLTSYDLYRSAPGSLAFAAARQGARISSSFAEPPVAGERSFVVDPASAQLYAWEYVASTSPVHFLSAYGYIASTTGDSIGGSNPPTIFMVVGRNSSGSMYWLSAPDSGYSVDNIAPAAPSLFTGRYSGGSTALHWGVSAETDFAVYRLYRGSSPSFVPGPSNLVASRSDTGYVDASGTPSYYKLSAVDVHGNESGYASLTPSSTLDVPGANSPLWLRLGNPQPNPAHGTARIAFELPRAAVVSLAVYDPSGRIVRTLFRGRHESGSFTLPWDLRAERGERVANGVYYVRFEAGGQSITRRMVAMR